MRALLRAGPLLLALGVALWGCSPSGDSPPKGATSPSGPKASVAAASKTDKTSNSQQVVLGLTGMT